MSKEPGARTLMVSQNVKGSETLLKSARQCFRDMQALQCRNFAMCSDKLVAVGFGALAIGGSGLAGRASIVQLSAFAPSCGSCIFWQCCRVPS